MSHKVDGKSTLLVPGERYHDYYILGCPWICLNATKLLQGAA